VIAQFKRVETYIADQYQQRVNMPATRQQRITLPASFWRYEQMWTKNTRIRHSTSESSG